MSENFNETDKEGEYIIKEELIEDKPKPVIPDFTDIQVAIINLPSEIRAIETKILAINNAINKVSEEIKNIKVKYYVEVNNEKDDKGKNVYSNEKLRDAEISRRLENDMTYSALDLEYNDKQYLLKETQIEHDFLKMKFRSIQIFVESMKVELRIN